MPPLLPHTRTLPSTFLSALQHYIVTRDDPLVLFSLGPESIIQLQILDDDIVNADRNLTLTLEIDPDSISAFIISVPQATVIIEDNDGPIGIEIFPTPTLSVIEGEAVAVSCGPVDPSDTSLQLLVNGTIFAASSTDVNGRRVFDLGSAGRQDDGNTFQCVSGAIMTGITTLVVFCELINKLLNANHCMPSFS